MILLAIDPAAKGRTGWALFTENKILEYGKLSPEEACNWEIRGGLLKRADILIIESQFLYKNPHTYGVLVAARCMWTEAAKLIHFIFPKEHPQPILVHTMAPEKWMRAVTGDRRFGKGSSKNMEAIRFYVRKRWGIPEDQLVSDDAICAIAMGTAFLDKHQFEGL